MKKAYIPVVKTGGGSTVIANPTLDGTENSLNGIEIDETKYKVESKQYYEHWIKIYAYIDGSYTYMFLNIVTDSSAPFTKDTLAEYLGKATSNPSGLQDFNLSPYTYPVVGMTISYSFHYIMLSQRSGQSLTLNVTILSNGSYSIKSATIWGIQTENIK